MNAAAVVSQAAGASGEHSRDQASPVVPQRPDDRQPPARPSAASLLLVEDERDAREMLALNLRRRGYRVDACSDGDEALAQVRADHQAVIIDLVMPRVDGLTVLSELNRRGSTAVPIVITSFADKQRAIAALNLGARYLLEKPFTVERLCGVLAEALTSRPATLAMDEAGLGSLLEQRLASLGIGGRERTLVVLILRGQSNAEIGRQLGLTPQAVKSALFVLYRKLGVASRGELFHLLFPV